MNTRGINYTLSFLEKGQMIEVARGTYGHIQTVC